MNDYTLEDYKDDYCEILYEMKKDNLKCYIENVYGWNEEKQLKFFNTFIKEHRAHIKVIKIKEKVIGLFTNYIDEHNEDMIHLFYIDKNYQRKGIGTNILINQLNIDQEGKRNTILSVFKTNSARNLYERVGFKIYEETDTHYKMRRKI